MSSDKTRNGIYMMYGVVFFFLTGDPINGGFVTFPPHYSLMYACIFTVLCLTELILDLFESLVIKLHTSAENIKFIFFLLNAMIL